MSKNRLQGFLFQVSCGFFLGISIVAPGVSGSVMAVMMGIYRDLIEIISNPFKNFKRNVFFLLPIGIGALISLALFIKLLSFLFDAYPAQTQLLFLGLIAGGFVEISRQARDSGFKPRYLWGAFAAFAFTVAIGLFGQGEGFAQAESFHFWYFCVAGLAAGISSMVPGLSVSLILMLFGVYSYLLHTAANALADLPHVVSVAFPVGVCFLIGMVLFSKVIKLVFDRYAGLMYLIVFGFMCGTLIMLFPETLPDTISGWIACALTLAAGLLISGYFQVLGKRFKELSA